MSITDWSMEVAPRSKGDVKYFSLEQADRSLVLLRRIVGEVVEEYAVLLEMEEMIESAEQSGHRGQLETARKRLVDTVDNLQSCLEELDQMGVELQDFSRGIVDFPYMHEDRPVSLCWLLGESHVSHWHEREAGFACRQPISLLTGKGVLITT